MIMKLVKSLLLYLLLIITAIVLSFYSSGIIAEIADKYFGIYWGGGWLDISSFLAIFLGYGLYSSFIITLFGGKKKYWVLGFLLIPLLFLELLDGDFKFFGVSILLAVVGWVLGVGILKLSRSLLKFVRSKEH
jgi:hypothetical protein